MVSKALFALAPTLASAQLHSLAVEAGLMYWGTAVGNQAANDQAFMAIVNDLEENGQLVPENGQKWEPTEPNREQFTYEEGDVVANIATGNGQILRCHTLVWYNQLPGWVSSGGFSAEELQSVIETHISNVMGHYVGQCYAWDVVNEAASDDGGWRPNVFYDTMGTDFLAISFNAARAADPDTKLYYNDYNLEYNAAKTDRAIEIVEIIQGAGAPIDGVGFQGHLIVGETPSREDLAATLERFTALGVEVAYTEVDIRHSSLPATDEGRAQQGDDYAAVVGSCLDVEGCIGFTVWGFSDKYSWVEGTFPGEGEACLYDADLNRKPAWTSVSSLLAASSGAGGAEPTGEPTVTGEPTAEPTVTDVPTEEPTGTGEPTGEPTATEEPTDVPTATEEPTQEPPATEEPTAEPTGSGTAPPEESSTGAGEPPATTTFITSTMTSDVPPPEETTGGGGGGGPAAGQYEQCGGNDWPGPFECVEPFTCQVINDYYSQCL